jgi:hypothetical protein
VAALAEQLIGVSLLEVAGADLGTGDVGGDGQYRGHAPMGIEQPVDEVQVAGAATAHAGRQLARELCLRTGRESRSLFVADMHPADLSAAADGVGHRVEAVAYDPVHALDARFGKAMNQTFCDGLGHDLSPFRFREVAADGQAPGTVGSMDDYSRDVASGRPPCPPAIRQLSCRGDKRFPAMPAGYGRLANDS